MAHHFLAGVPLRKNAYIAGVVALAVAGSVYVLSEFGAPAWDIALFLGVLILLGEWLAVDLPVVGSASLSFAGGFAAVVLGGPSMAVVVHAIGSISVRDIASGKPPLRMAFNTGQYVLVGVVAGLAQVALGVTPLLEAVPESTGSVVWFVGTMAVALVMAITNMVLVGIAISLDAGVPLLRVWRDWFSSYLPNLAALALLGIVLAQLVAVAGIPATLLIVVPFAVARQTFQVYSQQSEAYRETVKSLVTTLEAKDPYTRGHSERVAWYAREISEEIGLSDLEVQRIEWSALLHDIGKVAIARRTLTKPDKLSDEEYQRIKEHPTTAAEILAEIELLDEVIPYVAMHHERIDGRGYPEGVSGENLPLGARILAVADCFDAMTSDRAYRAGLSYAEAIEELNRVRDEQVDGELADALLRRIDSHTMGRLLEGSGRIDV